MKSDHRKASQVLKAPREAAEEKPRPRSTSGFRTCSRAPVEILHGCQRSGMRPALELSQKRFSDHF